MRDQPIGWAQFATAALDQRLHLHRGRLGQPCRDGDLRDTAALGDLRQARGRGDLLTLGAGEFGVEDVDYEQQAVAGLDPYLGVALRAVAVLTRYRDRHAAADLLADQAVAEPGDHLGERQDGGFAPVRTSATAQQNGVILLDVPTEPVEIGGVEGLEMSPAALLPLLDTHAKLHLILEPVGDDDVEILASAELGDLYRAMIGWSEPHTSTLIADVPVIAPGTIITSGTVITPTGG